MEEHYDSRDVFDEFDELEENVGAKTVTTEEKPANCLQECTVDSFNAIEQTSEAFNTMTTSSIHRIADEVANKGKSVKEGAKEALAVKSTFNVANDQDFQSQLDDIKKDEIKSEFRADSIEAGVRVDQAKRERNEAFYKAFRPILEFDFSNITGIERKDPKNYNDRSYGMPVMVFMLVLLTVPFAVTTLVFALLTIVNMTCEYIGSFGKVAMRICSWFFIVGLIVLAGYLILSWIETQFGIPLIHQSIVTTGLNFLRGVVW